MCTKIHKTEKMRNLINSIINGHIMVKFCTEVAQCITSPHIDDGT